MNKISIVTTLLAASVSAVLTAMALFAKRGSPQL